MKTTTMGSACGKAWMNAPRSPICLGPAREAQALERLLEAFPNPSFAEQWVVYQLPEGVEHASLSVRDMLGREWELRRLGKNTDIVELPVQTWPSGLYTATLSADGIPLGSVKLIVQR